MNTISQEALDALPGLVKWLEAQLVYHVEPDGHGGADEIGEPGPKWVAMLEVVRWKHLVPFQGGGSAAIDIGWHGLPQGALAGALYCAANNLLVEYQIGMALQNADDPDLAAIQAVGGRA